MRPPLRPDQIAHLNHEDEVAALRKTEEQYAERILQQEEEIRALRKRVEELEHESGAYLRRADSVTGRCVEAEARAEQAERERASLQNVVDYITMRFYQIFGRPAGEAPEMMDSVQALQADLDAALTWRSGGTVAEREEVLQAVLDKLWTSAHEFGADVNDCGNPTPASRERWQKYAEELLLRWLEYHSPSAAARAKEAVAHGGVIERGESCPACKQRMLYRTKAQNVPTPMPVAVLVSRFCGNQQCPRWLREEPILEAPDAR